MSSKKKMEGNPDANLTSIGNYIFQKTVGEGNFAKVKLAKHKVAIKIIDKTCLDDKKLSKLYREVRIMKLLHHPHIVKLYEVIETKYTIFLVMEYVSGGELYDYLVVHGRMKEKEARAKFRQILSAVSYCHKKRVIHRDLKAENLLLDGNLDIKIADFGFSNHFDPDGKLDTFCGSPPYAAPELFQGKRYTGPEVDVWSLGVILYVLSTGCLPFDGKNLQEMRESVCRGKYRIPFYLSENCEKLLRKFLIRDPLKRPSLDILIGDPWLNEGYEESCISKEISEDLVNEDGLILSVMETKLGIEKASIIEGLKEKTYDDNMAIYFLLYHEKMKNGDGAVIKIGEQIAAKNPLPEKHKEKQEEVVKQTSISVIQEEKSDETTEKPMEQKRPSDDEVSDQSGQMTPILAANNVKRGRRSTISGDSEIPKIQVKPEQSSKQQEMVKKMETVQVKDPSPPSRAVKTERLQAKGRPLSMVNGDRPSLPEPSESDSSSKEQGDKSIKKTDAPRKRTPTITGFLKIGKDKPATKPEPSDDDAGSDGSLEEVGSNQGDSKPRSLRFTFNSNTTSSKEPDTIVQEVLNGCQGIGIKAKLLSRYLVECVSPPPTNLPGAEVVKIEIEICKLPRLKNLHGLRFKRQGGASADYKTVCEQLLAAIKL